MPPPSFPARIAWLLPVAICCCACGCGPKEPKLSPARGVLLYNGRPVPGAEVVLHPAFEGPGWMPVATADENGAFAAGTKVPGDGALPGLYRLTVAWRPQVNADGDGPNVLPARYSDPKTSALELTVGPDTSEIPTFPLTD